MKLTNMHIHSNYSFDCKMKLSRIASILNQKGIRYAAITDHVEFRLETIQEVLEKLKIRDLEIDQLNEKFQNITLLKGIEVSEPYLYPKEMEILKNFELDYILGSIHRIIRNAKNYYDRKDVYKKYYDDVLKMVEFGHIDAVGHLDYIRRYYEDMNYTDASQFHEVLSSIISNHLLLEINTSAERRVHGCFFPSISSIQEYISLGGKNVVVGSDAHQEEELDDQIEKVTEFCKDLKLDIGIFHGRKFEKI